MWVNFVDLIFNNFHVNTDVLENTDRDIRLLIKVFLKISNIMNLVMLYLGIVNYFIFIYIQKIRTPVHKTYVIIRFIVIFSRFLIFFTILSFYLKYWYYSEIEERTFELYKTLFTSSLMVILEVNDIKWCFDLREIVFYDN